MAATARFARRGGTVNPMRPEGDSLAREARVAPRDRGAEGRGSRGHHGFPRVQSWTRAIKSSRLTHLDLDPAEPHLVARLAWVQHLVTGLDPGDVGADRRDDARAARRGRRCRSGEDQPRAGLRLVARRLDDEVLVERLERRRRCDASPGARSNDIERPRYILPAATIRWRNWRVRSSLRRGEDLARAGPPRGSARHG